ncbi:Di-trans-poly-cis-decaprenylcistransferase [Anaeromyces robustus]|uniref:Alkyl transferase n=1 Tax=Anaeromyces robustus TaxID=1754192 RepID=A0A1Y1XGM5_9FUNG|nr:Di-trans-poly-cis-decaprenylcistransferase [Anaeromyces robustus]|eukprot:ORX84905.1 Di-trans-poly-cis-decaprenylcistransferase [Anaeromyces robustus]
MADTKLEFNYYLSKIISYFYNLFGWLISFFNRENKNEDLTFTTINENNEDKTYGIVNKIIVPSRNIFEKASDTYYKWCLNVLKRNEIPKHIAFIMDGNRRYARASNIKPYVAHLRGFESLEYNLEWLLYLGVKVVTVYAFSIENFKRTPSEVNAIFEVTKLKIKEFMTQGKFLAENGIKFRLLGDTSLLPDDLMDIANKSMEYTKNNDRFILNICFAYTSRYEITHAIKNIVQEVQEEKLNVNDITEETISNHLLTYKDCPSVDILVRTSNETRFSDFMLWQICEDCQINFVDVYWPVFNFYNMLPVLLSYQRTMKERKNQKKIQ